jgi:hypothetical protein
MIGNHMQPHCKLRSFCIFVLYAKLILGLRIANEQNKEVKNSWVLVVHAYNPTYLEG